jgi:hypothetical protein
VRGEDPSRRIMPMPRHPWPKTVPLISAIACQTPWAFLPLNPMTTEMREGRLSLPCKQQGFGNR